MDDKLANISKSPPAEPRVLFFSGKGGVGKTTLAGTAAVRLSRDGDRVLIASTDPAHSLSDLFDRPIGGAPTAVARGVDAVETDAPAVLEGAFEGLGPLAGKGSLGAAADLLKLASHTPGVDEIVSLDLLLRLLERPAYDHLVLDTAPTGHTLRLLALPELMDRYFSGLFKLRRQIARVSRGVRRIFFSKEKFDAEALGEELEGAQGRMRMLGELLRDPRRCSLVLVTIPEAMGVLETMRTLEVLRGQGMPVAAVAVNMLQPAAPDCHFCTRRRQAQIGQLDRVRELSPGVPIVTVEHVVDEPRGEQALIALAEKVWAGNERILTG